MEFEQIMPTDFTLYPNLKTFVIAKIKREKTEQVLKQYKSLYPDYFKEYEHLKLIKSEKNSPFSLMLFCKPENLQEMKQGFEIEEFVEMQLPDKPAIDKRQKTIYDQYWNILHANYQYPSKQIKQAGILMHYLSSKQKEQKSQSNMCLLYNSFKDQIIIEAQDESNKHPLRHCVMNIFQKLAEINKQDEDQVNFLSKQYYAKSLILIVLQEPCIMCSMALIHSRIEQVYYQISREDRGGLNENIQIHNNKNLNHKFDVFRMKQLIQQQQND